jgi:hypothetical protein
MQQPVNMDYAVPPIIKRHPPFLMLAISIAMAFAFAITFVIVMTLTLPRTDGAYGQMPFEDPLVLPVMAMGASVAALIVFPFFYLAIRSKPLGKSVAILTSLVMAELVIVTPLNAGWGFCGSFAAFAVGLIIARMSAKGPDRALGAMVRHVDESE